MNSIERLQHAFNQYLYTTFGFDAAAEQAGFLVLNVDEIKQQFGDLHSNVPMVIGKQLKLSPRAIAERIIREFKHESVATMDIAGPGFLNMTLTPVTLSAVLQEFVHEQNDFFKLPADVQRETYSVEYVSANPTGPLHLGHGRGGIIGDVLGNILTYLGHDVTKEFYINDAGVQMAKLGMSLHIRCRQQLGQDYVMPEDAYHGDYIKDLAASCIEEHGAGVIDQPDEFFTAYAYKHLLTGLQKTLHDYGISFDVWFSEKTLHESGAIGQALHKLKERGLLYTHEGADFFQATQFGDDKDRVVKKSDGEYTYVAADIAYLLDKAQRGFNKIIMVLGHDHHSYAVRLEAVRQALEITSTLDIILYQLVRIKASGQLVKMSKRAGTMVTLDDVIETVGTDVARFFYLHRKADAQLEFDLDLALKQTDENPVYYIQYAYVRTRSILEKAAQEGILNQVSTEDANHLGPEEALLIKKIVALKELLLAISTHYQTHQLTYYVLELATIFHRYYSHNRVIDLEHAEKTRARLLLVKSVRETLKTCLKLLGISAPESM